MGTRDVEGRVRPRQTPGLTRGAQELCPLPPSPLSPRSLQCHSEVRECALVYRLDATLCARLVGAALAGAAHARARERRKCSAGPSGPSQLASCRLHFGALPEHSA